MGECEAAAAGATHPTHPMHHHPSGRAVHVGVGTSTHLTQVGGEATAKVQYRGADVRSWQCVSPYSALPCDWQDGTAAIVWAVQHDDSEPLWIGTQRGRVV